MMSCDNLDWCHFVFCDTRVEIDAKIASGYFSTGQVLTDAGLAKVKGRDWEDIEH